MKKLIFSLFALSLLATTACKKSKDSVPITKENIAGTYKLMTVTASVNGSPAQDADTREVCEKDDLYKLNADNSFNYVDAGTVCNPAGDTNGSWALTGDQISSDFFDLTGTVTKFDGSTMEITLTATDQGMTYTIKSTFKKQ